MLEQFNVFIQLFGLVICPLLTMVLGVAFALSPWNVRFNDRLLENARRYRRLHALKATRHYNQTGMDDYKAPRRTFYQWFWGF